MNEFTPKRIGKKNKELERKIVQTYYALCQQANELAFSLDGYLGYPDKEILDPSMFFEFMNSEDPRAFLYLKFIEKRGITFPGISIAKVIDLGLVDVHLGVFTALLEDRIKLQKIIQSINELMFHFPLRKLWNTTIEMFEVIDIDDKGKYTFLSSEFENLLQQHTGRFTLCENDNTVLAAIEKTVDSLNELVKLGVIGNAKGKWANGISQLANAIVFETNSDNPLSVKPRLNQHQFFRRFFSNPSFEPAIGNQTDMLKFDGFETLQDDLNGFVETDEDQEDLVQSEDSGMKQKEIVEAVTSQTE